MHMWIIPMVRTFEDARNGVVIIGYDWTALRPFGCISFTALIKKQKEFGFSIHGLAYWLGDHLGNVMFRQLFMSHVMCVTNRCTCLFQPLSEPFCPYPSQFSAACAKIYSKFILGPIPICRFCRLQTRRVLCCRPRSLNLLKRRVPLEGWRNIVYHRIE